MRYVFTILLTLSTCLILKAQIPDSIQIYTAKFEVASHETVEIPIKVIDYEKIESIQFSMNWNPRHFEFVAVSSINPDSEIKVDDIGVTRVDQGIVVFSFIDPISGGISLPDSSSLFTLKLKAIGAPTDKAPFNISNYDRKIDVYGQSKFRTAIAGKMRNIITAPTKLSAYYTSCSVSIPSIPNGKITVRAYGSRAPLRLFFAPLGQTNPDLMVIGNGSSITFDSLSAGAYDIRIVDADNKAQRDTIHLENVNKWNIQLDLTPPSCGNTKDGSAAIKKIEGFFEPYVYTWSTFDLLSPRLNNIGNGSYYLRVEDRLGCVREEFFSFNVPLPDIKIVPEAASCDGASDGKVHVSILQGDTTSTDTYAYILDNGTPVEASEFITEDLSPGMHSIKIIDDGACEYEHQFYIGINHAIEILDTTTLNIGCDLSPGGFLIEVRDSGLLAGDIVPSLFPEAGEIIQEDSLIEIRNLPEGSYTLYLDIDGTENACRDSVHFTVTIPSLIKIEASLVEDESCYGATDGRIDIVASGGLGSFYNYMWDDGTATANRENIEPGDYCITVTDDSGCIADTCITIIEGSEYSFELNRVQDLSCHNILDGEFAFQLHHLSGSISEDFTINIVPKHEIKSNGSGLYYLDSLSSGSYKIEIISDFGCVIDTFVNISAPTFPSIAIDSISHAGCFNSAEGSISLSASLEDSTTFVKWEWNTGDTSATINNLVAGTYQLTVTDVNGCENNYEYFIDSLGGPSVEAIFTTEPTCYGLNDGSIHIDVAAFKSGIKSIIWNDTIHGNRLDSVSSGLHFYEIQDSSGCVILDSIYLSQPDSLIVTVETEPQYAGGLGEARVSIQGGTEPYDITWSTTPVIKGETEISVEAGNYTVVVLDKRFCLAVESFIIDNKTSTIQGQQPDIYLYPNPAQDRLFLRNINHLDAGSKCSDCDAMTVYIYNSRGESMNFDRKSAGEYLEISTSSFTPGLYHIIILDNNTIIYNNKFSIQR